MELELLLSHQPDTQVNVSCDGQPSHTFDLARLMSDKGKGLPQPLDDPETYGKAIYQALFPSGTPASHALNAELQKIPARILLVTEDDRLDSVQWEYAYDINDTYGPTGFLVLACHFVRGLAASQRTSPRAPDSDLHIVAIPSNPLGNDIPALDIDGEWIRLKEIVQEVPYAVRLERTRPPTIEQTRALLANQRHLVVHFMGHGGQSDGIGTCLYFEKDNGDLDPVTARQLVQRVRGTVFLVTLNACVSAAPGPTPFSNLAAALVRHKVPYALGMRFSIDDADARAFSRTFYTDLARGSSVEEALLQARLALAKSLRSLAVGVPVLYTSLAQPADSFASRAGNPIIDEHQPRMEISALPPAEGAFLGRIDELKKLGEHLTGDGRPRIITIHGGGGQGKSTLAREAVKRFAHAWPGGVWAISLENLPARELFVNDLARFLGISTQEIPDPTEIERLVYARLISRRTLLVLDNAETLINAVERNDAASLHLVEFIRQLPGPSTTLLITSRVQLGWSGEFSHELGGLSPEEGYNLFRQCAPQRMSEIAPEQAKELSRKLEGHPLGLLLLGKAFNDSAISLSAFLQQCDARLEQAENKYVGPGDRQRTLNACIEISVDYLTADLRILLSGLWVFHARFLAEAAVALFHPANEDSETNSSPILDLLHILWQRGLLAREEIPVRNDTVRFYHLLPTTRPYVEHHLEQAYEREKLLAGFGVVYFFVATMLFSELDRSAVAVTVAQQVREDLERGVEYVAGIYQGLYRLFCGRILYRVGNPRRALELLEQAMETAQEEEDQALYLLALNDTALIYQNTDSPQRALELYTQALPEIQKVGNRAEEATTLNNIGMVYQATGQPQKALESYKQALPIMQEVGDRAREATTLTNMGEVYRSIGQPQEALRLYEQALPIREEVGDRAGEATTLNNMALVYQATGQPQKALASYEQALPIMHEVGNRAGEATTLSNIGMVYQARGKLKEALKRYEEALLIMREVDNWAGEATMLTNMGGVHQATGKPQEALRLYMEALPMMQKVGNRAGEAAILTTIGEVYRSTGKPREALQFYGQALPIMQEIEDVAGEATALTTIGEVYQATGRPREALQSHEQALRIMQEVGNRVGVANILSTIGEVYRSTGKPREALAHYEQALPIMREVDDRVGEATTLNNMGNAYQATGKMQEALERYEQALPIMREIGHRAGEALILNNMGELYRNRSRPQEALALYKQALPIMREIDDRAGQALALNNMALVYHATGQVQEALALYKQALPIMQEVGNRAGESLVLNNMGELYRITGRSQEALQLYEQALPIMREAGNRAGEALALNNKGLVYHATGQLQEAFRFYEQALLVMQEVGDRAGKATTLSNMGMVYQTTGQPDEAFRLYEQALSIKREVGDRAGEVVTLHGLANLLQSMDRYSEAQTAFEQSISLARHIAYPAVEVAGLVDLALLHSRHLNHPQDAIMCMEHAIAVLVQAGLPQDATGSTLEELQRLLQDMRSTKDTEGGSSP